MRDEEGREDFDALGQRIHPAASRIERLSGETPAVYVAFDLLAREDEALLDAPFSERRAALERLLAGKPFASAPVELMETVDTPRDARSDGSSTPRERSPSCARRRTCRASARACSRSSACARSTP